MRGLKEEQIWLPDSVKSYLETWVCCPRYQGAVTNGTLLGWWTFGMVRWCPLLWGHQSRLLCSLLFCLWQKEACVWPEDLHWFQLSHPIRGLKCLKGHYEPHKELCYSEHYLEIEVENMILFQNMGNVPLYIAMIQFSKYIPERLRWANLFLKIHL